MSRTPRWKQSFPCLDCRVEIYDIGEYYMVLDDVWAASGLAPDDGFLCIGCLETRLGRPLNGTDFLACPLNLRVESQSLRLRVRLGDTTWMNAVMG